MHVCSTKTQSAIGHLFCVPSQVYLRSVHIIFPYSRHIEVVIYVKCTYSWNHATCTLEYLGILLYGQSTRNIISLSSAMSRASAAAQNRLLLPSPAAAHLPRCRWPPYGQMVFTIARLHALPPRIDSKFNPFDPLLCARLWIRLLLPVQSPLPLLATSSNLKALKNTPFSQAHKCISTRMFA